MFDLSLPTALLTCLLAQAQSTTPPDITQTSVIAEAATSITDNLLTDIRSQPMGRFTVADLPLPDDFLIRARDRMLIDLVRRDRLPSQPTPLPRPSRPEPPPTLSVLSHAPDLDLLRTLNALQGVRPESRGFVASILPPHSELSPFLPRDMDERSSRLATLINTRLAIEGLLPTTARAVEMLGPQQVADNPSVDTVRSLRQLGLPLDLLEHFEVGGKSADAIVPELARRLLAPGATIDAAVRDARYLPRRRHDFRVSDEGGTEPIEMVRVQIPTATIWGSQGGSIETITRILTRLPECRVLASVNQADLRHLLPAACEWAASGRTVCVVSEALPVAQWAQDTSKPGTTGGALASLVPRYASQNEDGSVFAPNESYMAAGWSKAGLKVVHSQLLFQGGNVMAVLDKSGLVLLVGEAEVLRNTALGLSEAQTIALFRAEFGADRVVVLTSASFHLDLDFTIRSRPDEPPLVLLGDWREGASDILKRGIATGIAEGVFPDPGQETLRGFETCEGFPPGSAIRAVLPVLGSHLASLIKEAQQPDFATRDRAEWAARLQIALDLLIASEDIQDVTDPISMAYYGALRRNLRCRDELNRSLRGLGWNVVLVPDVPGAVSYVNGLHDSATYFMPSLGGRFESLDRLAASRIAEVLGEDVQVVSIPCPQVQLRAGGLHCVVAAYRRDR